MGMSGTKVKTCLPLSHEVDSGTPLLGVGDDVRLDCGSPELALLRTAPTVGMGQHELDIMRH